jgi:hypothetical protein
MNALDVTIIRGYVQSLPITSGKDELTRVAVVTDDGAEYHILHKGAGISLAGNVNANVEVTGSLLAAEEHVAEDLVAGNPGYWMAVKSYRLIDGFDDPWYDDTVR